MERFCGHVKNCRKQQKIKKSMEIKSICNKNSAKIVERKKKNEITENN